MNRPQQVRGTCCIVKTPSPKPSNPALSPVPWFTSSQPISPLLVSVFCLCKGDRGIDALGHCSGQDVTSEVSSMGGGGNDRCAKPLAEHVKVLRPPDLWPSWHSQCSQLYWLLLRPAGEGQEWSLGRQCYLNPFCPLGRGCFCQASLGVVGLGCCPPMEPCPFSSMQPAPCLLLPAIWILEATV